MLQSDEATDKTKGGTKGRTEPRTNMFGKAPVKCGICPLAVRSPRAQHFLQQGSKLRIVKGIGHRNAAVGKAVTGEALQNLLH